MEELEEVQAEEVNELEWQEVEVSDNPVAGQMEEELEEVEWEEDEEESFVVQVEEEFEEEVREEVEWEEEDEDKKDEWEEEVIEEAGDESLVEQLEEVVGEVVEWEEGDEFLGGQQLQQSPNPDRTIFTSAAPGKVNLLVTFADVQMSTLALASANSIGGPLERHEVRSTLQDIAAKSQENVLNFLQSSRRLQEGDQPIRTTSYWISNEIYIADADPELQAQLMTMEGVKNVAIEEEYVIEQSDQIWEEEGLDAIEVNAENVNVQWGVDRVRAPEAWAQNIKGRGITVGIIDSGVRHSHVLLESNYGNYWHDPFDGTTTPNDDNGHGTHVTATIVGSGGYGVAPEARWIACKGCKGRCPQHALLECAQFMLCPDPDNNCAGAPNVVNNSWGGNKGGSDWFQSSVDAWEAAGIIPVFSAGNNGSAGCGSIRSPGDYENVLTFGSSDIGNGLSHFSSTGPTSQGLMKPDVTAPGSDIVSAHSMSDHALARMSGTSMAAPHGTGVVALMLSNNSKLTFDSIKTRLQQSAKLSQDRLISQQQCSPNERGFPNNDFGHGVIDAPTALAQLNRPITMAKSSKLFP